MAQAEAPCPVGYEETILYGPPEEVHWSDLEDLARKDPERALRRWNEMEGEALDELRSGHRAGRVLEGYRSDAWQRAQFLAIRQDLIEAWQPRNGLERQLLDQMAQAQTAMFFWQERLSLRASVEPLHEARDIEEREGWNPPRVSEHQALGQAAGMVDRFNKNRLTTAMGLGNGVRRTLDLNPARGLAAGGERRGGVGPRRGSGPTPGRPAGLVPPLPAPGPPGARPDLAAPGVPASAGCPVIAAWSDSRAAANAR